MLIIWFLATILLLSHQVKTQGSDASADELLGCTIDASCPGPNIGFFLYTRNTQNSPYEIVYENEQSVQNAPLMPNRTLVILIHGFTGNRNYSPNSEIRPALFANGEYNVISVDWGPLAKSPCYVTAVLVANTVGNCIARFLNWLYRVTSAVSCSNTRVIGLSLGAHVAGSAGIYSQRYGCRFPRLTGLDPANPLYPDPRLVPNISLDQSDGDFVDVVHTNVNVFGQCGPNGHVDFYINNGKEQPGCSNSSCSHTFSAVIYARTIDPAVRLNGATCNLTNCLPYTDSNACSNTSNVYNERMGFYVSTSARGTYIVPTSG